jgi:hypothetical protein
MIKPLTLIKYTIGIILIFTVCTSCVSSKNITKAGCFGDNEKNINR